MTTYKIIILGGYGHFGQYIAKVLAKNSKIELIILGRSQEKANECAANLISSNPVKAIACDIFKELNRILEKIQPFIVIHTCGPFQIQDYVVAKACLKYKVHYLDLADAREFVCNITQFDNEANAKDILLCSGASSVPGLSSAIIEAFSSRFSQLESVEYAIATAQLTNLGYATTAAVLSYAGKPFTTYIAGQEKLIYGWQDLKLQDFWRLSKRFLGNCDIPDLELFPKKYQSLKTIRFQAGLELKPLLIILFIFSWLVRLKLLPRLDKFTQLFLNISRLFNYLGSNNTGFYMQLTGLDDHQQPLSHRFDIYAEKGDGLYIPCIPAIVLTENLINQEFVPKGAMPCMDLISLERYLAKLKELNLAISWREV